MQHLIRRSNADTQTKTAVKLSQNKILGKEQRHEHNLMYDRLFKPRKSKKKKTTPNGETESKNKHEGYNKKRQEINE